LPYAIEYTSDAEANLRVLTTRQQRIVLDEVDKQLAHQPTLETRNRKRMRPNSLAPWELRIGNLRIYYDIYEEPSSLVVVLAIGIKLRNRVWIGGRVFDL